MEICKLSPAYIRMYTNHQSSWNTQCLTVFILRCTYTARALIIFAAVSVTTLPTLLAAPLWGGLGWNL